GRAQAGPLAAGIDRAGLAAALPSDHDDDAGSAVRGHPAGVRRRHRLGAAQSAGHLHRRRAAAEPDADALYDAGDLSRDGAAEGAADRAFAAADRARPAGSAGAVTATGGGVTGMKAFVFELSAYSMPPSPGGGGSANVVSRGGVKSTTDTDFAAT